MREDRQGAEVTSPAVMPGGLKGLVALAGYGLSCVQAVRGYEVQTLSGLPCESSSRLQRSVSPSVKWELVNLR